MCKNGHHKISLYSDGKFTIRKSTMNISILMSCPVMTSKVPLYFGVIENFKNCTNGVVSALSGCVSFITFLASKNRISVELPVSIRILFKIIFSIRKVITNVLVWGWYSPRASFFEKVIFEPINLGSLFRLCTKEIWRAFWQVSPICDLWKLLEYPLARSPKII